MIDNIQLWFGKDIKSEEIVIATTANLENEYECPICGSKIVPKGTKDNAKVTPHFAHVDKSKCTSESMLHWWFKNKFIETGDTFKITNGRSDDIYVCESINVEKYYNVDGKMYKPDLTVNCENGDIVLFEFKNTNKKKLDDYIDIWRTLGYSVVEIDVRSFTSKDKCFKPMYHNGKIYIRHKYSRKVDGYIRRKNILDDDLDRLKNINWFFIDINNYMNDKISSLDLSVTIDEVVDEDRDLVEEVMSSKSCFEMAEKYVKDIAREILSVNKNWIDQISLEYGCNITVEPSFDYFYRGSDRRCLRISTTNHDHPVSISLLSGDIFDKSKSAISEIKESMAHRKDLHAAQNNEYINMAIQSLLAKYQLRDSNYRIYSRFGTYGLFITLSYNYKTVLDLEVGRENIIYETDVNKIVNFIDGEVSKYIETVDPIVNINKFSSILNKLNKLYNGVYIIEKTDEYSRRRRDYIDFYKRYRFGIKESFVSEEDAIITLYKESVSGYKLDVCSMKYSKNKLKDIKYDNANLYKIKFQIAKEFNNKIKEILKYENVKVWGELPYETR